MKEKMKEIVSNFNQLPYLFVGTGFSMRYANAFSWKELLFSIWQIVENSDKRAFDKSIQRIEYELKDVSKYENSELSKYSVFPKLAAELQNKFNNLYFNNEDFEKDVFSDSENNEIISNKIDPFKYFVMREAKKVMLDRTKPDYFELENLIKHQNKIGGIITTNYDLCLEKIFTDFSVTIGQDKLLLSNTNNAFEIYKIHGCISEPNSIVITYEDYEYFERKLKYLSAKLLTIFVEHPVVFVGYGMGDHNIQSLFKELAECLTSEELEKAKNNFIFISPAFGGVEEIKIRDIEYGTKKLSMTELVLNDYSLLYSQFGEIKSSMTVKLMRKIQDMVADFIYSTEATNHIMVGGVNSPEISDDQVALYIGTVDAVSQIGFNSFGIMEVIEDVLFEDKPFLTNKDLIFKTYKNIRSTAGSTYLPIYKYIYRLGIKMEEIPKNYLIYRSIEDIKPSASELKNYIDIEADYQSLQEILHNFHEHTLKIAANIKFYANKIDAEELGDYIRENYRNCIFLEPSKVSTLKKLTAIYDFLKYHR